MKYPKYMRVPIKTGNYAGRSAMASRKSKDDMWEIKFPWGGWVALYGTTVDVRREVKRTIAGLI